MVIGLLILVLLTVLGLSTTTSTTTYTHIVGNEKFYKLAFYAADAASAYVAGTPTLFGGDNITVGGNLYFPDNADPSVKEQLGTSPQYFKGQVEYIGSMALPADSGYEVGEFVAHRYQMTCYGYGPRDIELQTDMGFYRVGF